VALIPVRTEIQAHANAGIKTVRDKDADGATVCNQSGIWRSTSTLRIEITSVRSSRSPKSYFLLGHEPKVTEKGARRRRGLESRHTPTRTVKNDAAQRGTARIAGSTRLRQRSCLCPASTALASPRTKHADGKKKYTGDAGPPGSHPAVARGPCAGGLAPRPTAPSSPRPVRLRPSVHDGA
jgi:hypothetical protein